MPDENKLETALTKDETALLWQLLNAQGVAVPARASHIMATLYAKTKAAANVHGIPTADDKA